MWREWFIYCRYSYVWRHIRSNFEHLLHFSIKKHQCPSTNTLRETTLYEYIDTFSLSGIISKKTAHHIRKLRNLIHPNAYHNHLRKHKRGICKKDFERVEKYYSKITDDLLQNI